MKTGTPPPGLVQERAARLLCRETGFFLYGEFRKVGDPQYRPQIVGFPWDVPPYTNSS